MATIRKRRKGWQAQVRRAGYAPQSGTFDTRTQAERWARTIEGDMARGRFVDTREAERTTLGEALDRYAREVTPQKAQAYREGQTVARLRRHPLALRPLATVRSADIASFIGERQAEGVGANTIRLDLALLSHLFEVAASELGMEGLANPVKRVRKPKLPAGRDRRLKPGEERKLLEGASRTLRPVISFALETAMRRAEIAGLRRQDIDFAKRTAHLLQTKTGDPRTVPLSPKAIDLLRKLPRRLDGRLFGMTALSITHAFEDACRRSEIVGLTFHDLRHEATSRLFERGLSIEKVAAITGHRTWAMLRRYTHPRAEDIARELAAKS